MFVMREGNVKETKDGTRCDLMVARNSDSGPAAAVAFWFFPLGLVTASFIFDDTGWRGGICIARES
jgi:hypothetical protein